MITIFTQENCPNCKSLKNYLDTNNINYEVSTNYEELREKGFDKLPIIKDNNNYLTFREFIESRSSK